LFLTHFVKSDSKYYFLFLWFFLFCFNYALQLNLTWWKIEQSTESHKLHATSLASVNINYHLSSKCTTIFVTLDTRIEIIYGTHNVLWVLTWVDISKLYTSLLLGINIHIYVHCRKISNLFVQALETGRKTSFWWTFLSCFTKSLQILFLSCNVKLLEILLCAYHTNVIIVQRFLRRNFINNFYN
jgi:hypothetical protein